MAYFIKGIGGTSPFAEGLTAATDEYTKQRELREAKKQQELDRALRSREVATQEALAAATVGHTKTLTELAKAEEDRRKEEQPFKILGLKSDASLKQQQDAWYQKQQEQAERIAIAQENLIKAQTDNEKDAAKRHLDDLKLRKQQLDIMGQQLGLDRERVRDARNEAGLRARQNDLEARQRDDQLGLQRQVTAGNVIESIMRSMPNVATFTKPEQIAIRQQIVDALSRALPASPDPTKGGGVGPPKGKNPFFEDEEPDTSALALESAISPQVPFGWDYRNMTPPTRNSWTLKNR